MVEGDWVLVFTSNKPHHIEIIKAGLEENEINSVEVMINVILHMLNRWRD